MSNTNKPDTDKSKRLVHVLRFVSPQDGPGLSVASSCKGCKERPKSGRSYQIVHRPEIAAFEVSFFSAPDAEPVTEFIPLTRVMTFSYFA